MNILLASAWEPELFPVRALAASRLRDADVAFGTVGVGPVEAALGASRLLARRAFDLAIFVGTCGVFSEALPEIPEVLVAATVSLVSGTELLGFARFPDPMPIHASLDPSFHASAVAQGARSVHVANTLGITVDDPFAARLAERAGAEHLEAFAFARAARSFEVPCGVVLGAANRVGSAGRDEWRARHVQASEAAAEIAVPAVEDYLRRTTRSPSPARR